MNKYSYIPEGYNAVIPALAFKGADAAIKWYKDVFDAKEKMRFDNADKTVAHAELILGDSVIMLSEENAQYNQSPKTLRGNSINLCIYVPDVDATIQKAVDNKAQLIIGQQSSAYYGCRRSVLWRQEWSYRRSIWLSLDHFYSCKRCIGR